MAHELRHRSYGVGVGVAVGAPISRWVIAAVNRLSNRKMYAAMSAEITMTMSVRRTTVSRLGQVTFCSSDQHSWANWTMPALPRGSAGALAISDLPLHGGRDSNSQPLVLETRALPVELPPYARRASSIISSHDAAYDDGSAGRTSRARCDPHRSSGSSGCYRCATGRSCRPA